MITKGFTLLEFLIVAILVIILMTLTAPTMTDLRLTYNVKAVMERLHKDLVFSRHSAINQQSRVTFCPLNTVKKCQGNWQQGYSIFIDKFPLNEYDEKTDTLLLKSQLENLEGRLIFTGGKALIFDSAGMLDSASGTFQYCHNQDKTAHYTKALIINLNGRIRKSQDIDHDGIDEKNYYDKNSDLSCVPRAKA